MNLETLYAQLRDTVSTLDFSRIWPGFAPLKFALYDQDKCFFDGHYVEKTDEFCANTSIVYQGEQIAIWMVQEAPELPVLASKIVHEMFHGYQQLMGWDCSVNELEALYRYRYEAENLSRRLHENALLLALLEQYDESVLGELLAGRKRRSIEFPYEFRYESKVEELEGTANYVEWQVLKQLDPSKADELTARMRAQMTKPEALFPIRLSCYFTGALMLHALRSAGRYSFEAPERPVIASVLQDVAPSEGDFPGKPELLRSVSEAVQAFHAETDEIIRAALEQNELVLNSPLELTGVNVYNARCHRGYITSTYFLMYREGTENKLLPGNFVIRMQDEKTIAAAYRWA